ncbi:membrane magnesium transporter-like [Vicia villosa]|uniref:membrane magnesium transporter-like n=1 Tax=Vicia villosa TaxID=3911 RepID=UPI00273C5FE2|nr:membrane magnesium transporter-like [Vicia villosa]
MSFGFLLNCFSLVLFHAAYSTLQYKSLLKITEEEFSGPPFNMVIQLFVGLLLCFWAALTVLGKFLSIQPQSDENSFKRYLHL